MTKRKGRFIFYFFSGCTNRTGSYHTAFFATSAQQQHSNAPKTACWVQQRSQQNNETHQPIHSPRNHAPPARAAGHGTGRGLANRWCVRLAAPAVGSAAASRSDMEDRHPKGNNKSSAAFAVSQQGSQSPRATVVRCHETTAV